MFFVYQLALVTGLASISADVQKQSQQYHPDSKVQRVVRANRYLENASVVSYHSNSLLDLPKKNHNKPQALLACENGVSWGPMPYQSS
eukprot:625620-Amphidinium_carterae.1